jgi:hypothetical protein
MNKFRKNLPVCEIMIPKSLTDILNINEDLKEEHRNRQTRIFYPHGRDRCSVEVNKLVYLGPKLLDFIFKDTTVSLQTRSIETGGFGVADGFSTILCDHNGYPLKVEANSTPRLGLPVAFKRTTYEDVYVIKAKAKFNEGDGILAKAMQNPWDKEKTSEVVSIWRRRVLPEWMKFSLDTENLVDQLTEACDSTLIELQDAKCNPVLRYALTAALNKAKCENCEHIHYGLAARRGEKEPSNNQTPIEAVIASGRTVKTRHKIITM